jgi:hypothetical protein
MGASSALARRAPRRRRSNRPAPLALARPTPHRSGPASSRRAGKPLRLNSSLSPPLEAESMFAAVKSHLWRMETHEWRSDSCPELSNPGVRAPLLSSPTSACVRLHGSSPSSATARDSTVGRHRSRLHRWASSLLFSPAHHCLRAAEEVRGSRS